MVQKLANLEKRLLVCFRCNFVYQNFVLVAILLFFFLIFWAIVVFIVIVHSTEEVHVNMVFPFLFTTSKLKFATISSHVRLMLLGKDMVLTDLSAMWYVTKTNHLGKSKKRCFVTDQRNAFISPWFLWYLLTHLFVFLESYRITFTSSVPSRLVELV